MSYPWVSTRFNPYFHLLSDTADYRSNTPNTFFDPAYFTSNGVTLAPFLSDIQAVFDGRQVERNSQSPRYDSFSELMPRAMSELISVLSTSLRNQTGLQQKSMGNPDGRHYGMLAKAERDMPLFIAQSIVLTHAVMQDRNAEFRQAIPVPQTPGQWVSVLAHQDLKLSVDDPNHRYGALEATIFEEAVRKAVTLTKGDICPHIGSDVCETYIATMLFEDERSSGLRDKTLLAEDVRVPQDYIEKHVETFLSANPSISMIAGVVRDAGHLPQNGLSSAHPA